MRDNVSISSERLKRREYTKRIVDAVFNRSDVDSEDVPSILYEYQEDVVAIASVDECHKMIDWCKHKIELEKKGLHGLSGKRMEGYETAMLAVMSYLHQKKQSLGHK